jgi:RES domain-containing protein
MAGRRSTKVKPFSGFRGVKRRVRAALAFAKPWSGFCYRSASPGYATSGDLVTGEGSRRNGGRYTTRGRVRGVYGTLRAEDALAEALASFRKRGIADADALPRVTAAIAIDGRLTLDLRDPAVLGALDLSLNDLVKEWEEEQTAGREAFTQALGRACFEAGIDCLLVPSARLTGQSNLVAFPEALRNNGGKLAARGLEPSRPPVQRG